MTRNSTRRPPFLTTTALAAALAMIGGSALAAANVIRIDVSQNGGAASSLSITQAATGTDNIINRDGTAGTNTLLVKGPWDTLAISQKGSLNKLFGAFTAAGTDGALSLNYGGNDVGGNGRNIHSLTIGSTLAPTDPTVTVNVKNTDPTTTPNTVTDVLNGTGLTYTLDVLGTNNTIVNTISSAGAVTLDEDVTGDGNAITHTVSLASSVNSTVSLTGDGNTVVNTSTAAGDKTFSVTLSSDDNTVTNNFTGGTGTQTSTLLSTGALSKIDFVLTAAGAGSSSAVTFADVTGDAAAALVRITQGAGAILTLNVTGTGFNAGTGATGGNAIFVNQSAGTTSNVTFAAAADNYFVNVVQ